MDELVDFEIGTGSGEAGLKYVERFAARQIVQISKETRAAVRAAILRSFRDDLPAYDAAKAIRSMIGLTINQTMGALDYRAALVESGLAPARVEKLFEKYVQQRIRQRAETIARTETMRALNQGALAEAKSAVKSGLLGANVRKVWSATGDGKICPQCEALDGESVPLSEDFPGAGATPPLHPACRCSLSFEPEPAKPEPK